MNRKPLITVVEQDPILSMLVMELLAESDYAPMLWTEHIGAIAFIRRMMPDLIILDLWLRSRGDGWTVFNHLQHDPATRQIPIILCADDSLLLQMDEAQLVERAAAVLEKPFEIDHLLTVVTDALTVKPAGLHPGTQPVDRPMLSLADAAGQPDVRYGGLACQASKP
jgi:CheY-like chemotaxis protein